MSGFRSSGAADAILSDVRRLFAPLLAFSVVINLTVLVMPIYMLQIYDRVLTSRNLTTLLLLTIVAFAFLATHCLLTHYRSRIASRLGMGLSQQLAQPVFVQMLKGHLETASSSVKPVRDLESIRDFFTGGSMIRLLDVPWSPIFLCLIFLLHPLTGFVAFTAALALLLVDWLADRYNDDNLQQIAGVKQESDEFLQSSLRKASEIWSMGMGAGIGSRWHQRRATALAAQAQGWDISSTFAGIRKFIQQGAQMAMLGVGAYLAILEEITAGTIVAGSIICSRALGPLGGVTKSWRHYRSVKSAFALIKGGSGESHEGQKRKASLQQTPDLRVEELTVDLGETLKPVIRNLNFVLQPGEGMSIVGPSGTGKSLLAKTLVGAKLPAAGTVSLQGIDLHNTSTDRIGRMIGYVPQRMALMDGTVGENVGRFGDFSFHDLDIAIGRAGLSDAMAQLPDGYDTPIEIAAKSLSPIQLRFLALARALYGNPALLVIDQFDTGLDQESLQLLGNMITTCRSLGQTVVWVTDRVSVVQMLDHVMILSKRGVERLCPVDQLVDQKAIA